MRRTIWPSMFAVALLLTCCASVASACSAVLLFGQQQPLVGRNYDWHLSHALVMVNQPGIAKRALSFDNPAKWTSRFGSVTINQYGRELPCEGINEAGLAIAILWLDETEYPQRDDRPSITNAQWLQHQLDTAETIEQVIASDNSIRITPLGGAKVHYFVADATGDCAVVEFLNGKMVVHRGDTLPHPIITNSTCAQSKSFLRSHTGFGGTQTIPTGLKSLHRYARLALISQQASNDSESPFNVVFAALDSVRNPNSTRWQVVYDLKAKQMHFRTRDNRAVRRVDLSKIDFGSEHSVQVFDIEQRASGDVTPEFRDYTFRDNRRLVERSIGRSQFASNLPAALIQKVIRYPEEWCHPVSTVIPAGQ